MAAAGRHQQVLRPVQHPAQRVPVGGEARIAPPRHRGPALGIGPGGRAGTLDRLEPEQPIVIRICQVGRTSVILGWIGVQAWTRNRFGVHWITLERHSVAGIGHTSNLGHGRRRLGGLMGDVLTSNP
jgi:hypothetical protein